VPKVHFLEKMGLSCHYMRKTNLKLPYLENKFQKVTNL
jgi:hypothetical protein